MGLDFTAGLLGGIQGGSNAVNEISKDRLAQLAEKLKMQAMEEIGIRSDQRKYGYDKSLQDERLTAGNEAQKAGFAHDEALAETGRMQRADEAKTKEVSDINRDLSNQDSRAQEFEYQMKEKRAFLQDEIAAGKYRGKNGDGIDKEAARKMKGFEVAQKALSDGNIPLAMSINKEYELGIPFKKVVTKEAVSHPINPFKDDEPAEESWTLDTSAGNGTDLQKVLAASKGTASNLMSPQNPTAVPAEEKPKGLIDASEKSGSEDSSVIKKLGNFGRQNLGANQSGKETEWSDIGSKTVSSLDAFGKKYLGANAKETTKAKEPNPKDLRSDGSKKGPGWRGSIPITSPDGSMGYATEYSIGVNINGKEIEIPSIVPTLTKDEFKLMAENIIPNHKQVPESIVKKAVEFAKRRISEGKNPFKD